MNTTTPPRPLASGRFWERAAYAAALLLLLAWNLLALLQGSNPVFKLDGKAFYAVGETLLRGLSPYDREAYAQVYLSVFGDPPDATPFKGVVPIPSTALLFQLLALLPWSVADAVYTALSAVVGLGLSIWLCVQLMANSPNTAAEPRGWQMVRAGVFVLAIGGVSGCLTVGQPSLLAIAGALGAAWAHRHGRWGWVGVGLLVASLKPPVVLLAALWLVYQGAWRGLLLGGLLLGLCTGAVLAQIPLDHLGEHVRTSVAGYASTPANQPPLLSGMDSLLFGWLGRSWSGWWLLAGAGALWVGMRRVLPGTHPLWGGWLLAWLLTAVCVPLKVYDAGILLPVAVWLGASSDARRWWLLPGFALAARPGVFTKVLVLAGWSPPGAHSHVFTAGAVLMVLAWWLATHPKQPSAA